MEEYALQTQNSQIYVIVSGWIQLFFGMLQYLISNLFTA